MNNNKPYVVFTTYPEYPEGNILSNNKPYIGISTSPEKLSELCRKVYPDIVCGSPHKTRKSAEKFMRKLHKQTPHFEIYDC